MKNLIWAALFVCLAACAPMPRTLEEQTKLDKESNNASIEFYKCQTKNVDLIDDGISDASTIALALTNSCLNEYFKDIELYANAKLENNQQFYLFKKKMLYDQQKAAASLTLVLRYRKESRKLAE